MKHLSCFEDAAWRELLTRLAPTPRARTLRFTCTPLSGKVTHSIRKEFPYASRPFCVM